MVRHLIIEKINGIKKETGKAHCADQVSSDDKKFHQE